LRVIVDTNVLLSFLIAPTDTTSAVQSIVVAAFQRMYKLVLPADVIAEIRDVVDSKPHFHERISRRALDQFLDDLLLIADILPRISEELVRVVRDPADDYLIALAHIYDIDVLVSGDDVQNHESPRVLDAYRSLDLKPFDVAAVSGDF
jgi:putative PIN family toxin of toxin-antitoxin system